MAKIAIDKEKLMDLAAKARDNAYAPYSHFQVGAALLTSSGEIFLGANVENASYGLTCCAERVAVFKAVSEGYCHFLALALSAGEKRNILPCGACLQVLQEFSADLLVIFADDQGSLAEISLKELLPHGFCQEDLQKNKR
ncbi:MAG: cytidine deaminase [Clostridiales bacterium]